MYDAKFIHSLFPLTIFVFALFLLIFVNNVNAQFTDVVNDQSTSSANQSRLDTSILNITMSRSACFGACPVYYVEIDGDGKVIYRGYKNVNITGERTSSIPVEKVKELVNQFNRIGYFNLKDRYDEVEITDQATVQTSIRVDGIFKSVYDYLGAIKLPELLKLRQLENTIDEVTNSSQWVGLQELNSPLLT